MSAVTDLIEVVIDESFTKEMADMGKAAKVEYAALQARVAELERTPDLQKKVHEFTEVFERPCRATLYGDGSGRLEYEHPDGWIHAMSFETITDFMMIPCEKLKEACNL